MGSRSILVDWPTALHVLGEFEQYCLMENNIASKMSIVRNLKTNLLELPAMMALKMVARFDTITRTNDILNQFSSLFEGLGNLGILFNFKKVFPTPKVDEILAHLNGTKYFLRWIQM